MAGWRSSAYSHAISLIECFAVSPSGVSEEAFWSAAHREGVLCRHRSGSAVFSA
jgi:hypothetical protein